MREFRRFVFAIRAVPLSDLISFSNEFFAQFDQGGPFELWANQPHLPDSETLMLAGLHPWAVETLLREAVGRAAEYGTADIRDWNTLARIMNFLQSVSNKSYSTVPEDWVFHELFRVAHQQFHWQRKPSGRFVHRYIEMYEYPPLTDIIEEAMGSKPTPILALAIGLYGYFSNGNVAIRWPFSTDRLGLNEDQAYSLLNRFSATLPQLAEQISPTNEIDENFPYKESLFRQYPLIRTEQNGFVYFACPIPRYFLYRAVDGLFFDIVNHPNFANSYGPAFEHYAIRVAQRVLPERFTILPQQKYGSKKERKDSVDLIITDHSATAFVECKTRRVAARAKADLRTTEPIDSELDKLALNVAKTYRTVRDALNGNYPHWKPNARPCYLIVLMLTDWFLFSERLRGSFMERLKVQLDVLGVDRSILTEVPLIESSAEDFEMLCAVLNNASLDALLAKKADEEHQGWELLNFLNRYYRADLVRFAPKVANMSSAIDAILAEPPKKA